MAAMTHNDSFPVTGYHKFDPGGGFGSAFVFLFEVFQFADVMHIDFFG
jgi:hypothetical protein